MTKKKTLLVLGGGEAAEEYIKLISTNYNFILVDKDKNCPARWQCARFIEESIFDSKSILKVIYDNDYQKIIDGVICLGTDAPITAAEIAEELNLNSVPIEAAKLSSNKILIKNIFEKLNIFTPKFYFSKDLSKIIDFIRINEFPLIIKPDDSRGARGVSILWDESNIEEKFITAKNLSKTNTVIVEEYIDGHQVSSESIIYDSKSYNVGFSDRNYEYVNKETSFVIENGGDLPVSISLNLKKEIGRCVDQLAKELQIKSGVIKGDIIIKDNKVYFIEIALRLSGGYFCSHKIPYNTGVNILDIAAKIATNQKIELHDLKVKFNRPVSQRFFIPENGHIEDYNHNYTEICQNVIFSNIQVSRNMKTSFPDDHTKRLGCVITTGKDKKDAVENAISFIKNLQIKYRAQV